MLTCIWTVWIQRFFAQGRGLNLEWSNPSYWSRFSLGQPWFSLLSVHNMCSERQQRPWPKCESPGWNEFCPSNPKQWEWSITPFCVQFFVYIDNSCFFCSDFQLTIFLECLVFFEAPFTWFSTSFHLFLILPMTGGSCWMRRACRKPFSQSGMLWCWLTPYYRNISQSKNRLDLERKLQL